MTTRVALIGSGAVASLHASNLSGLPEAEVAAVSAQS